jgi:hypothetical protein
MSADDKRFGNGFDQNRKEWADTLKGKARQMLEDYYAVPKRQVVSNETQKSGEYNSSTLDSTQILDYGGVDWLVQTDDRIIPVGERVRKNGGEFSIRTDNANSKPCEIQLIPNALKDGGLFPLHYLYIQRNGFGFNKAWLMDTRTLIANIEMGAISVKYSGENDDGTAYKIYNNKDIMNSGCVLETWEGE